MTSGDDRNKARFKMRNLPYCDHGATERMLNCVCFTNAYINLVVLSVTREYHRKTLELFDQQQCIAAYLQRALAWVSAET